MCGQQQFISGVCANVSSSFQILNSIAPAVQGMQPVGARTHQLHRGRDACTNYLSRIRDYNLLLTAVPPKTLTSNSPSLKEKGD